MVNNTTVLAARMEFDGGQELEDPICLSVVPLVSSTDARRLLTTHIGDEPLLYRCLRNSASSYRAAHSVFAIPKSLDEPWRTQSTVAAKSCNVQPILYDQEDPVAALVSVAYETGAKLIAIAPPTSPFISGDILDACFSLLSRFPADYIRAVNFPQGAAPLVVRLSILETATSTPIFGGPPVGVDQRLARCLPLFRGMALPAPPALYAPDLDLSLRSDWSAEELEAIGQSLIARHQRASTMAVIQEVRRREQSRVRRACRMALLRPRRAGRRNEEAAHILCIGYRANRESGGDTSLDNFLRGVDRRRFEPLVATPSKDGTLVASARALGMETICAPLAGRIDTHTSAMLTAASELACFASRRRVELVYANSAKVTRLGAVTAFILGVPLVARVIEEFGTSVLESSLIASANLIVAPSRYLASHCEEMGVPNERLRVVPEGLSPDWFEPCRHGEDLRQQYAYDSNAPLIGVVGRLGDPRKAIDQAVRAAAHIVACRPDARMVICGRPADGIVEARAYLERLIGQLGLTGLVSLVGFVSNMHPVYSQFDVLLHSAPREGFGLAVLEAMGAGVPIVAVRGGGVAEHMLHGHTGILVERSDPLLLARGVLTLLDRPELRLQFGRQAREHVRRQFSNERFARGMEGVLNEVLS